MKYLSLRLGAVFAKSQQAELTRNFFMSHVTQKKSLSRRLHRRRSRLRVEKEKKSGRRWGKTFSCLIKSSIGCFKARNYLLIEAVYVFDRN